MATPAQAAALPRPRPYRRFLTSALHTKFVHAALVSLLISWDNAALLGPKSGNMDLRLPRHLTDCRRPSMVVVPTRTCRSQDIALLLYEPVHILPPDRHVERWFLYVDLAALSAA